MFRDNGEAKSQSFGSILICVTAKHASVAFVLALAHICSVSGQRGAAAFQPLFTGAAAAAMERIGMRGWHSKLSLLVQCRAAKVIYAVTRRRPPRGWLASVLRPLARFPKRGALKSRDAHRESRISHEMLR